MSTVRESVDRLRKIFPNRDDRGFIYSGAVPKSAFRRITVHTLLVSTNANYNTYKTIIKKKKPKTVEEWHGWLQRNFDNVMRIGVLPAFQRATGISWSLLKIIGWHVNAQRKSRAASVGRTRNKTKRSRIKRG